MSRNEEGTPERHVLRPLHRGVEFDWQANEDALFPCLKAALESELGIVLSGYSNHLPNEESPYWYIEYRAEEDDPVRLRLYIGVEHVAVPVLVFNPARPPDVETWTKAVIEAFEKASSGQRESHVYCAFLLTKALLDNGVFSPKLAQPTTVGSLELRPARRTYVHSQLKVWGVLPESIFSAFATGILVQGEVAAVEWFSEGEAAAGRDLRAACALLSIAWDCLVTLVVGPFPQDHEVSFEEPGDLAVIGLHATDFPHDETASCPEWMTAAWTLVGDDRTIQVAVHAYYEGLQLLDGHPSMSFICFTTVLERLAQMLAPQVEGARARVEATARTVLRSDSEVHALSRTYGRYRHATAHAGVLHGTEMTLGMREMPGAVRRSGANEFAYGAIGLARRAAHRALLYVLVPDPTDGSSDHP